MTELLSFGGITALTVGLTEIIKRAGLPDRFAPIVAVVIGVALALLGGWAEITTLSVLTGIAAGLSACGLWDIGKTTVVGK